MGESHQHHFQQQSSSRLGLRNTGGEIVEVQGGHIVRSTGRKDRHSKVCTAKGPRDRRVRLSAHTAIQFYDVQDRLGYDRPSKAVDWLIKKAKAAIDELAELPAWNPTTIQTKSNNDAQQEQQQNQQDQQLHIHGLVDSLAVGGSSSRRATMEGSEEGSDQYGYQHHHQHQQEQIENAQTNSHSQSFLPPSLDSDAIADTIKSFFPMGASADSSASNSIHFHNYPPDLLSRTKSQNQDLRLSLQSFQDPMLMQSHHHQQHHHNQTHQSEQQGLFSGGHTQLGFDAPPPAGWSEPNNQQAEIGRFQRMIAWNVGADSSSGNGSGSAGGGGFMFHSPPPPQVVLPQPSLQQLFGHNQFFSQRGPLQSSNSPSVRAWIDLPTAHQHHHQQIPSIHSSAVSGIGGFAPGEFAGFRIPARIQGEEEHDGISNKPSSTSSDSRH